MADTDKMLSFARYINEIYYKNLSKRERDFVIATKLGEEAGEIMGELHGFYGYKPVKEKPYTMDTIAAELADAYIALQSLAYSLAINLEAEVEKKLNKNFANKNLLKES